MREKFQDFSADDIRRMLSSREARELAAMLNQMDTDTLSKAAALAGSGDTNQATSMLQPFLNDPKVKAILERMKQANG